MNSTIAKFGYPTSLVKEYGGWVVLLREKQVTLGSLVLAAKDEVLSIADLSADAAAELPTVAREIETLLRVKFGAEKINYLALMMVDPHLHFHVIPRYSKNLQFNGSEFIDHGWPKHPNMLNVNATDATTMDNIKAQLISGLKL